MALLGKKMVVGVSVTPEVGIEVAQIDYATRRVLNYVSREFKYDCKNPNTFDLDIFKDTLYDLFTDMQVPIGSEIVLNLPTTLFRIKDWPASMDGTQLLNNIEDEINDSPQFHDLPGSAIYSHAYLPNSTMQFNKIALTAADMNLVSEIALQLIEMKYKPLAIDVSVNSTLNALIYSGQLEVPDGASWVMVLIEGAYVRIFQMLGKNYIDCYEEKINISPVFDDAENCAAVVNAINPILAKIPSSLLYIVSKTGVMSANTIATKVSYASQIAYLDAITSNQQFIQIVPEIPEEYARKISLDVIGAAIYRNNVKYSRTNLNLFNQMLGDIWLSQTPPVICGIEFSVDNAKKVGVVAAIIILLMVGVAFVFLSRLINQHQQELDNIQREITSIEAFLKENEGISTEKFSPTEAINDGVSSNTDIYRYYQIVGTEIPTKLWLTKLKFSDTISIEGQADNLECVYGFYRNIKDYNPKSEIKLQKLALASNSKFTEVQEESGVDAEDILTSMNADFYEFRISDAKEEVKLDKKSKDSEENSGKSSSKSKKGSSKSGSPKLMDLEPIE
ncbi:MAG: hypothetical protein MJ237_01470 [bacterium]|nr:hypothetical protein [bacterium]